MIAGAADIFSLGSLRKFAAIVTMAYVRRWREKGITYPHECID